MHDLCLHLPKMRSLKFLSLRHCPLFPWHVKPRGKFTFLHFLSLVFRDSGGSFWPQEIRECLEDGLKETRNLRLCILNGQRHILYESMGWPPPDFNLLRSNGVLATLDLFNMETDVGEFSTVDTPTFQNVLTFEFMRLSTSLERLTTHYLDGAIRRRFTSTHAAAPDMSSQIQHVWNFLGAWADFVEDLRPAAPLKFLQDIEKVTSSLPKLRKFVITGSPEVSKENLAKRDIDGFMNHVNQRAGEIQDGVPEKLQRI